MMMKMMKVKRLKCLESNYVLVILYYLIFTSLFNDGVSTRACITKDLVVLGSFENISGHYSQILYQQLGYLHVHPLRLLSAHDLLSQIVWHNATPFILKILINSKKGQHRQIRGQTCIEFFKHNLKRITRIGCLFENHPT